MKWKVFRMHFVYEYDDGGDAVEVLRLHKPRLVGSVDLPPYPKEGMVVRNRIIPTPVGMIR